MDDCGLKYIPNRLKRGEKPLLNLFAIGEYLYRRCNKDELQNPFAKISLRDISVNRSGLGENILCNPDDVLYSIKVEEEFDKYNKEVCTMIIKDLNPQSNYHKVYTQTKDNIVYTCEMKLLHDPVPCMYPHCVFSIYINGSEIDENNYNQTIGKLTQIRNYLREELASMIYQNIVSQSRTAS